MIARPNGRGTSTTRSLAAIQPEEIESIAMTTIAKFTQAAMDSAVLERPVKRKQDKAFVSQHKEPHEPKRRPAGHRDASGWMISWPNVIWLTMVHIGCLAAPFCFTWEAVV